MSRKNYKALKDDRYGYVIQFKEDGTYFKSSSIVRTRDGTYLHQKTLWTNDLDKAKIYRSEKLAHRSIVEHGVGLANAKVVKVEVYEEGSEENA